MRVLIDARSRGAAPSGTAGLRGRARAARCAALGVEVAEADGRRGRHLDPLAEAAWQARLARAARRADVLHHPLPRAAPRRARPQVVTVHDLAFVARPGLLRRALPRTARPRPPPRRAARPRAVVVPERGDRGRRCAPLWGVDGASSPRTARARRPPRTAATPATSSTSATPSRARTSAGCSRPTRATGAAGAGAAGPRPRRPAPTARAPGVRLRAEPDLADLHRHAAALVLALAARGLRPAGARGDARRDAGARRATSPRCARSCGDAARYVDPRDPASIAAGLDRARRRRRRCARSCAAAGRARAAAFTLGGAAPARTSRVRRRTRLRRAVKIAILGTRGIPASYSGFETAAEQLARAPDRARPRGRRLLPPARRRQAHQDLQGRAARPPADGAQQVPRHVRAHARCRALHCARAREARRRAVLHRRQRAAVPGHPRGRHPDGHQRRRPRLRPPQVAGARQALPALRRAQRAALGRPRDHRLPRRRRRLRAPLRTAHRRRPLRRRGPGRRRHRHRSSALGLEPREYVLFVGRLEPENNPHVLVEAFARIPARALARHEARRRRRRAVRRRVHPRRHARGRPARRVPGLRLRPRLLGAPAPRLRLRARRPRSAAPTR